MLYFFTQVHLMPI